MNLSQLGLSALNAAQARLITAGHNINNVGTDGYSRQRVIASTAGGTMTGYGFIGRGVQVDTVSRSYDRFLSNQFIGAQSRGAKLAAYGNQVTQINNLLGDNTQGIPAAIQKFFDGIQAVASTPNDPAARQELLGRTDNMVSQINQVNRFLNDQRDEVNNQISAMVMQVNSHVARISDLNREIRVAGSGDGHVPNDLLDQRDLAVTELNLLVKANVLEQDGQYGLIIGSGQLLLSGDTTYPMNAGPSDDDPRNVAIYTTVLSGANGGVTWVAADESSFKGGSIAGLLQYRCESLDTVQRQLGQMAAGLAFSMNAAHAQGVDQHGAVGLPLFSIDQPQVLGRNGNAGTGVVAATINVDGASEIQAADYSIRYDGVNYAVTRLPGNQPVFFGTSMQNVQIDGMTISMAGAPTAGDTWMVMPARGLAGSLKSLMISGDKFAAGSPSGGSANGGNALSMAQLQTAKVLAGGTMGINEAYSQIVNKVALHTQRNKVEAGAQNVLIGQHFASHQSRVGVNLNEEYVNLDRFQEQFVAASRLIEISSSLFSTLLSIKS